MIGFVFRWGLLQVGKTALSLKYVLTLKYNIIQCTIKVCHNKHYTP